MYGGESMAPKFYPSSQAGAYDVLKVAKSSDHSGSRDYYELDWSPDLAR